MPSLTYRQIIFIVTLMLIRYDVFFDTPLRRHALLRCRRFAFLAAFDSYAAYSLSFFDCAITRFSPFACFITPITLPPLSLLLPPSIYGYAYFRYGYAIFREVVVFRC